MAPPNYSLLLIMACFWLVYLAVTTQLVNPLGKILDERRRRMAEARAGFEEAKQQLDEAIDRSEREIAAAAAEAQKTRHALRAEGEATRRSKLDAARATGQERLAAFGSELTAATDTARAELRERTRTLARTLAEQLIGRRLAS